ncbi:GspE family protein, partial [Lactobacillus nasalidis]
RIIYSLAESRYFLPEQFQELVDLCWRRGLIVTSGPTGSGKTTTMYELARRLSRTKMVMTIEDPVEVHEESFFQAQVNEAAGISYASLLKAALRHRPDVLIIGEIRDEATAHLAVDAALSGHLVLATVHAKSTFQTISRLESLGVKNNELVNCLTAISYQRLLPGRQGPGCLLDLASRDELAAALANPRRGDFESWEENLAGLAEKGAITRDVAKQYACG